MRKIACISARISDKRIFKADPTAGGVTPAVENRCLKRRRSYKRPVGAQQWDRIDGV